MAFCPKEKDLKYDVTIIGGGIVGLATAYKLIEKQPGLKLLILEKESELAQHQTGHNSGVIHSGLYYKPGSLKAKNCINGYHSLIAFCDEYDIAYDLCGKIVVATESEQIPLLENLHQRGIQNGLTGLRKIDSDDLSEYEPHVRGLQGLWVPQTGIINYLEVAKKMGQLLVEKGVSVRCSQKVTNITHQSHTQVTTNQDSFETKYVVSCAGLYSDQVTKMTEPKLEIRIIPFRGEYFQLKPDKEHLVKNLIYPVPDPNFPFLGAHFTRMIHGGVEAGPNAVLAFSKEGYSKFNVRPGELLRTLAWPGFQKVAFKYWRTGMSEMYRSFSKTAFTKALQKLIPEIKNSDLIPGGAGVRAQASDRTGGLLDDFMIKENKTGVHVCNAPSPAATSSLSIGETIATRMLKRL